MNQTGELGHEMAQGDLNSQDFGSGARADSGKPNYSLLPLEQVAALLDSAALLEGLAPDLPIGVRDCLDAIASFQKTGRAREAKACVEHSLLFLMDIKEISMWEALEEVIAVFEYGTKKYAAFNWAKGMQWSIPIACYMRHVKALAEGNELDKESGRHHGAHLICNAMMLWHYTVYYREGNDLPTRWFQMEKPDESRSRTETA